MAPKKKNTQESINARLALVMKSGKGMKGTIDWDWLQVVTDKLAVSLGYRSTLKQLRSGKAKLGMRCRMFGNKNTHARKLTDASQLLLPATLLLSVS